MPCPPTFTSSHALREDCHLQRSEIIRTREVDSPGASGARSRIALFLSVSFGSAKLLNEAQFAEESDWGASWICGDLSRKFRRSLLSSLASIGKKLKKNRGTFDNRLYRELQVENNRGVPPRAGISAQDRFAFTRFMSAEGVQECYHLSHGLRV
jgi:hypothetical protein